MQIEICDFDKSDDINIYIYIYLMIYELNFLTNTM